MSFDDPQPSIVEQDALDELDDAIDALAPNDSEHPLVTRLCYGQEVVVAKERLTPHLQRAIERAVTQSAIMEVILCAGQFKGLESPVPILYLDYPDRVLGHAVGAVLPGGTGGVIMPHPDQEPSMREKYGNAPRAFAGTSASPCTMASALEAQASDLAEHGADLIMMGGKGFTAEMKRTVTAAAGVPAILANRLVAPVVEELVSSSWAFGSATAPRCALGVRRSGGAIDVRAMTPATGRDRNFGGVHQQPFRDKAPHRRARVETRRPKTWPDRPDCAFTHDSYVRRVVLP
jgi:protein AroM